MLMVSIIERERWSQPRVEMVTERQFVINCPTCGKLVSVRVVGKITRCFGRFTDRCSQCGTIRPDIERIVDQRNMHVQYTLGSTDRVF